MDILYAYCAAIGAALLLAQLALSAVGFGHHVDFGGGHDVDFHAEAAGGHGDAHGHHLDRGGHWFAGMLSFRAIVSAAAVFGLVGLGLDRVFDSSKGVSTFAIALSAGFAMMYAVAWLMRLLHALAAEGTVQIEGVVGLPGETYLTIPANKSGVGKVTVTIQDRTMEYAAMTSGPQIPTGASVVVLNVMSAGIVEVARAEPALQLSEGNSHA